MNKTRIITADYVWDGVKDFPVPGAAIVIKGGNIQKIAPFNELDQEQYYEVIEISGATLMPGLVDSHTHLSMDAALKDYLDHMKDGVADLTIRAVNMMRKDLVSGITTCRCLGDREFLDIACRKAVEEKRLDGPRLLVAGKGIRASSGHGFVGYPVDGLNAIKKAVNGNVVQGVDLIKFYITGTLKGDGKLPSYLSRKEIQTIIREAHQAGLPAASHCVGGIGLDWALNEGLDTLEHAYHISNDQIEKLIKSSTWTVLTPSPILLEDRINNLPVDLISDHKKEKEEIKSRMMALIASGIPYAVGSDGMHGTLANEVGYLVEMGATNISALRAATVNGAKIAGIISNTGSLEPGKKADIIAVAGNPLKDIKALKKIRAVMKEGTWIVKPEYPGLKEYTNITDP